MIFPILARFQLGLLVPQVEGGLFVEDKDEEKQGLAQEHFKFLS
jgi:hypothetical protein